MSERPSPGREPRTAEEPASQLLVMLLTRIEAERLAAVHAAVDAEGKLRGFPGDAVFDPVRAVWTVPVPNEGEAEG